MAEILGAIFKYFLIFALIYVAISYLVRRLRNFGNIQSRWYHPFAGMPFSVKDFYTAVEASIKEHKLPDTHVISTTFSETGAFSVARLYLRISRGDQMFLLCAAPFGGGSFVSWWFGETITFEKDLLPRIPIFGPPLARFLTSKTFFQMDSDTMFKSSVHNCVLEVIDRLTNEKGVRPLTELERRPIDEPLKPLMK